MSEKISKKEVEDIIKDMESDKALEYLNSIKFDSGMSLDKLIEKYEKKKIKVDKEIKRIKEMSLYEEEGHLKGFQLIGGIDEVGRGPLAGPVVTACVILPKGSVIHKINDSKKLSEKVREELFEIITNTAVDIGIGIADEKCIDEINILNATKKAMYMAIDSLKTRPDLLLIDALELTDCTIPQIPIIKGDSLSISIAAASIIAKVTRDRMIDEMDKIYPQYGFSRNKGYGTKEHIDAIKEFGISPIHRKSFCKNFC